MGSVDQAIAKPPVPRRKGPRLNAAQRLERGRRIAALRGRTPPVTWPRIAEAVGMSQSGCRDAYEQFLLMEPPSSDAMVPIQEVLDVMTVAIHGALMLAENGDSDAVKVQGFRTAVETSLKKLGVQQRAGLAPRALSAPRVGQQMQQMLMEFAELLRRHDVSDAALADYLVLAERQMGQATAIEGRVLDRPGG